MNWEMRSELGFERCAGMNEAARGSSGLEVLENAGMEPLAMQTEEISALEEAAGPFSSCLSYVHCLNIRIKQKDEGFHEDERAFSILSKEHLASNSSASAEGPNTLWLVSQPLKSVSLSAKWQELLLRRLLQVN